MGIEDGIFERNEGGTATAVRERSDIRTQPPPRFGALFTNDDYTPMEFVVHVLTALFSLSGSEAERVTMDVHRQGKGLVGPYTRDIAETRCAQAMALARAEGHPLLCRAVPWSD